jgi:hypothetical protein
MKPHERRAAGGYPFYKLARWDARLACWRDGREAHKSEAAARAAARGPGRYRISEVTDGARRDFGAWDQ